MKWFMTQSLKEMNSLLIGIFCASIRKGSECWMSDPEAVAWKHPKDFPVQGMFA